MVPNQIPNFFFVILLKCYFILFYNFFASLEVIAAEGSGCRAFRDIVEKEELLNLMFAMQ